MSADKSARSSLSYVLVTTPFSTVILVPPVQEWEYNIRGAHVGKYLTMRSAILGALRYGRISFSS
jgi:hypothetical protein